jgi:predicted SAM-dependent methyltransferase
MIATTEDLKQWREWVDFMVRTHEYNPGDVRVVKQYEFLRKFLEKLPTGGRILDVGAGQCEMRRFCEGFEYIGVDRAIGDAGWDYSRLNALSDVHELPFRSGEFDGAINVWVAEHVRDPLGMTGEMARVLRPGGWLMMFVPFVVHEHQVPHDYYRFTRFGAAALLEDNGFEQVEVAPDSSVGFAVAYEGIKHLRAMQAATGLPPEWKQQVAQCLRVFELLVQNFSKQHDFPADATALSFLAMGRKAAEARPGSRLQARRREHAKLPRAARNLAPLSRKLNVGCGHQKMAGWIGIDCTRTAATDIVRDITRGLPFDDSSIAEIYCDNVLEHIGPNEDFLFVLNEFYRVLKPGGLATIIVPDGRSQAAWQDPTHQRAFVPRSALYWNQDLPWPKLYGITANFDVEVQAYGDMQTEAFLKFVCRARPK